MFGNRRRRVASNSHLNGSNVNPSATTAAASAFLKSQAPNASLSSAAAAAALRARPTTPTRVADVQTKRTLRRSGSVSSIGSSTGSGRGSQLERRGSSGSMSERTFRDSSPFRSQPVPSAADAPPVPAIPKNMYQSNATLSHRRAASLETPTMRVASPPPNMASGRGSSLGPAPMTQSPRRAGQKVSGFSSVQESTRGERAASRGSVNSINFSLPTPTRPQSPVAHRQLTSFSPQRSNPPIITTSANQHLVYDPNTRTFLPLSETLAIEQSIKDVANKPVRKKKGIATNQAAGRHLAEGTAGGRPRGTAINAMEVASIEISEEHENPALLSEQPSVPTVPTPTEAITELPATSELPNKKKKHVVSDLDNDQAFHVLNSSDNDGDTMPATFNTRSGGLLAKKPSIVREDREREEEEDDTPRKRKVQESLPKVETSPMGIRTKSPSSLPRSIAGRGHGQGEASVSVAYTESNGHARSAIQPSPDLIESFTGPGVGIITRDSIRGDRVHSQSPTRATHFASTPDSLVVKHQPPPRSISPRKSAMKHSNSPRESSPVDGIGIAVSQCQSVSEGSNGSTTTPDELMVPKKKANRVSFDETNVIVGEAATPVSPDSPTTQGPQTKRPWYSIGRGKKMDVSPPDDDEIMKPRPALPSFGSVREKKTTREVEERPLVKPMEPVEPQFPLSSPLVFVPPTRDVVEYSLGQSNDHVVGAIISQDAASKNEANISKSREPLPPQVLSVEGSGYMSDTDSSIHSIEASEPDVVSPPDGDENILENQRAEATDQLEITIPDQEDETLMSSTGTENNIPEIAILQPTPTLVTTGSRREWPDMPGAWGSNSDSGSAQEDDKQTITEHLPTEPTPAEIGITEPTPEIHAAGTPVLGEIAARNIRENPTIIEGIDESEGESIYSDAAEDLSDLEGDGFLSIDAVVESPIVTTSVPGLAISTPPESPTAHSINARATGNKLRSSEPDIDEGWDKAQEYWSSLSSEKKKQLESEAKVDADGSDTEIEAKPVPKPRKKKRLATKQASVAVQTQPALNNERSYMIQPGAKAGPNGYAPMKTSMRSEPSNAAADTRMRKSMRGPGSMRESLRGTSETIEPRGSLQKKYRPMSYPTEEVKINPGEVKKHLRNLSEASAAAAQGAARRDMAPPIPTLRRRGSGDSDSSFKRIRASGDASTLKRSMRGSNEHQQSPLRSSRFSLRSLSPNGSPFQRPFGGNAGAPIAPAQTHIRTSMRSSYDTAPSLRGNNGVRIPGFGRSTGNKNSKLKPVRQRTSRFANSSDEDDEVPAFRSRFADSSDEDEPTPRSAIMPQTLRSTDLVGPNRSELDDADSSDLPDSDDEQPSSRGLKVNKRRNLNGKTNQGSTLASGSLRRSGSGRDTIVSPASMSGPVARPNQTRRGSFMSILRRKKPDPSSKVRKLDIDSPARRDTPLERSKSDLAILRNGRSSSPKLQKRTPPSRQNSGGWPLPDPPNSTIGDGDRPHTADEIDSNGDDGMVNGLGAATNENGRRPDVGARRFTATGVTSVDINGLDGDGVPRKKKKFGALRRMFRLDD